MENWINRNTFNNELVIKSSVKLLRNFENENFVNSINVDEARENIKIVGSILVKELANDFKCIDLWKSENNDIQFYIDKGLVSKTILDKKDKAALFINSDYTRDVIVNCDEHIEINCILDGYCLEEEFNQVSRIDDAIEKNINYAYDNEFGYLTASPYNIGTGMKVNAIMHFPMLKSKKLISNYSTELDELGIKCSKLSEDKAENDSNLFILYNTITLGIKENNIIDNLQSAVNLLTKAEKQYREEELSKNKMAIEDKIYRAYGILKNARIISSNELIKLVSDIRLGTELGLLQIPVDIINRIMQYTKDSVINIGKGHMTDKEKDIERARIVREILI